MPTYFDVVDVKNPHMKGNIGKVEKERAQLQWQSVREAVVKTGTMIRLMEPVKGLEDMVFCANPMLPGLGANGEKICLLSNMTHPSRKKEVPAYEKWFAARGYNVLRLSNSDWRFEGQGDALWHPGRRLLWGGYGFRTVPEAYAEIAKIFSTPVVLLKLENEDFYHLDTCLSPLSESEALYYPGAFNEDGRALIRALFSDAIEVPENEARKGFACNGFVLGKNVLIQKGNKKTCQALRKRNYVPVEIDTSEYIKSGGSVFCMKMMVYP
ncbi:MAG TPA: arginine deiminase-related protein [Bdellovibrionota bacterium]|nr:arginine deiminase-related protein [Bdellovibrionota bacterium]